MAHSCCTQQKGITATTRFGRYVRLEGADAVEMQGRVLRVQQLVRSGCGWAKVVPHVHGSSGHMATFSIAMYKNSQGLWDGLGQHLPPSRRSALVCQVGMLDSLAVTSVSQPSKARWQGHGQLDKQPGTRSSVRHIRNSSSTDNASRAGLLSLLFVNGM